MQKKKLFVVAAAAVASAVLAVPATAMAADQYSSPEFDPSPEIGSGNSSYPEFNPSPEWPTYYAPSGSPSAEDVAKANGVDFYIECSVGSFDDGSFQNWVPVKVTYSTRQAKNVSLSAGEQVLASFNAEPSEDYDGDAPTHCTVSFTTPGTDLINKDATVFIEHSNGSTDVKSGKLTGEKAYEYDNGKVTSSIKNGKITVETDGLSIYSLAVDKGVAGTGHANGAVDSAADVTSGAVSGAKSPQTGVLPASVGAVALMAAFAAAGALRKSMSM